MPSKVWDEITYPFPNFNGCTVEVWEWISKFIPHFIMDVPFPNFNGCTVVVWEWISKFIQHFIMDVITCPCSGYCSCIHWGCISKPCRVSISTIYIKKRICISMLLNLLIPGRCESNFKSVIFERMLRIQYMGTCFEIAVRWMPQNIFDDKSSLVQVMLLLTQIYIATWHNYR